MFVYIHLNLTSEEAGSLLVCVGLRFINETRSCLEESKRFYNGITVYQVSISHHTGWQCCVSADFPLATNGREAGNSNDDTTY